MHIPGYRIIRKINQGGMSTVYLAIQLSVGREVALKVMSPALNGDPVFSERFQREANIVGQLSHPNIVSIYDIGRYKNLNYIAMDYLAGGSIHEKMASGLSTQEVLRITREIAGALDHAHEKGYIHRDIKPENILFREDNSAVLSDFGVAKTVSSASRMTNAGTVVGTPHYMSPEQTRGKPVDGRADIYSLGVVFYEMLTGQVPYQADEAVAIAIKHLTAPIPKLPPQYQAYQKILNQLLAKDPDNRFQRGRDVIAAIDALEGPAGLGQTYFTTADSTRVQLLSLFRALLATTLGALREQIRLAWQSLCSLRWTPRRGLYRHPQIRVTEIKGPLSPPQEHTTVISTQVQQAAHYHSLWRGRRLVSRTLTLVILLTVIWGAFSLALNEWTLPGERWLPDPVQSLARRTAHLIAPTPTEPRPQPVRTTEIPTTPLVLRPEPETENQSSTEALMGMRPETPVETPTAAPPRYELRVTPEPENARVRILNIPDRYYPGIPLLPGRYHIETSYAGYDTDTRWIEVEDEAVTLPVSLRKTPVAGATFYNELRDGDRGPEMVIVPAGRFTMGSKLDSRSMPERNVRIPRAFAISRFEITFADYDKFARATDRPLPDDERWGRDNRPVINVSWNDALAYVNWLSESTGKRYRLPSEAEWEYAARAGTQTTFWWGEAGADADGLANCRRGCNSEYTGLFSSKSAPVGSYPANAFGLHSVAGNAAEWTQDCYRNHLLEMPQNGTPLITENCTERTIRGGSFEDSVGNIATHVRRGAPTDYRESNLGFRVVVELY
ncbi:serine/threonine-protein kinase PpkA [Marinimicrobium koreense]|uniref:non-specific serine/threonine protein kinase n=1 Tax=Marinimicrobium koreense TaxID=306545 RepID=A0A3N1NWT6_9GAMM|nr:bifunctional serine/threonine-protein kinase/formylglycine-generating enzyme family protein [Marinimicrobium koreense]ROQ20289.1 serine/threonine-protein kinase PpkA [Marinimicrobium koreense]